MSRLDHPRTYAHEEHAVLGILRAELGYCGVQTGLAYRIGGAKIDVEFRDDVKISLACGESDDLLGFSFEDERCEEVEEVDVADNVDLKILEKVSLESFWLLAPIHSAG